MLKIFFRSFSIFYVIIIDIILFNSIFLLFGVFDLESFFVKDPLHILFTSILFVVLAYIFGFYNVDNRYFSFKDLQLPSVLLPFSCLPMFIFENNFSFENIFITYTSLFLILISYRIIIKQSYLKSFGKIFIK
mgnify:CR=1 FL=1